MPENVFEHIRARVTAGFAKLVEDVNQYAAAMYRPTANGSPGVACRPLSSR